MTNYGIHGYNDKGELAFIACGFRSKPECDTCTYLGSHNDEYSGKGKDIPENERDCFAWGYGRPNLPKPQCWTDEQAADLLGMSLWWWQIRNRTGPFEERFIFWGPVRWLRNELPQRLRMLVDRKYRERIQQLRRTYVRREP